MNEYRVVWKRKPYKIEDVTFDPKPKIKRYAKLERAQRFIRILTSPEPWKEFGQNADDKFCCDGHECGCGGLTVKEVHEDKYKGIPPIEYVRLDQREVGKWQAVKL